MSWFETVGSREVYRGRVAVRVDEVATPDGDTVEREIVEAIDSVAVVATIDGDVVMLRQHRQATGRTMLELPAGVLDVVGESVVDAGARELAEETGLGGGEWTELGSFWASPGWSTERYSVVLARGVRAVGTPDDYVASGEEAHLEVVRLPWEAALEGIHDGAVTDATAALGLLLAARHLS